MAGSRGVRHRWTAIGSSAHPKGYRYTDPSGLVSSVVVKGDRIAVKAGKGGWPYSLDEPAQVSVTMQLVVGNQVSCAVATNPSVDEPGRFMARKSAAPATCP